MPLLYHKKQMSKKIVCICGKELGGVTTLQEENSQLTIEKHHHVIQSLVQVRRGQRPGTSEDQDYRSVMLHNFQRRTRKGVVYPINKQKKIHFESCVVVGEEKYMHMIPNKYNTKVELQGLDAAMRAGLGDHAILSTSNVNKSIQVSCKKQSLRYASSEQRSAGCIPSTERTISIPINFAVVSMGWLVGCYRCSTHTAQTALVFLHLYFCHSSIVQVKTLAFSEPQ